MELTIGKKVVIGSIITILFIIFILSLGDNSFQKGEELGHAIGIIIALIFGYGFANKIMKRGKK
jgi:hypothetical protein